MTRTLIEKLEAASEPSRELDAMVRAVLFGDFVNCDANMLSTCYNYPDCSDWDGCGEPIGMSDERKSYPSDWRDDERLPAYTSSLDASLARWSGCCRGGLGKLALLDALQLQNRELNVRRFTEMQTPRPSPSASPSLKPLSHRNRRQRMKIERDKWYLRRDVYRILDLSTAKEVGDE